MLQTSLGWQRLATGRQQRCLCRAPFMSLQFVGTVHVLHSGITAAERCEASGQGCFGLPRCLSAGMSSAFLPGVGDPIAITLPPPLGCVSPLVLTVQRGVWGEQPKPMRFLCPRYHPGGHKGSQKIFCNRCRDTSLPGQDFSVLLTGGRLLLEGALRGTVSQEPPGWPWHVRA